MEQRQRISSGSPFEPVVGYSRAVRVGSSVHVAGTAPIWPDGSVDPSVEIQARRCFEIVEAALDEAGASLTDVVRNRVYLVDRRDFEAFAAVHGELFGAIRPALTGVIVRGLLDDRWKLEVESDAVIG